MTHKCSCGREFKDRRRLLMHCSVMATFVTGMGVTSFVPKHLPETAEDFYNRRYLEFTKRFIPPPN